MDERFSVTVRRFLRHGVPAAVTGGLYWDIHAPRLVNLTKLYAWLFLLVAPLVICGVLSQWAATITYTALTTLLFAAVKFANYRMHLVFTRNEPPPEPPRENAPATERATNEQPNERTYLGAGVNARSGVGATIVDLPDDEVQVAPHAANVNNPLANEMDEATAALIAALLEQDGVQMDMNAHHRDAGDAGRVVLPPPPPRQPAPDPEFIEFVDEHGRVQRFRMGVSEEQQIAYGHRPAAAQRVVEVIEPETHHIRFCGFRWRLSFVRTELETLLERDLHPLEAVLCVLVACGVCLMSSFLYFNFYCYDAVGAFFLWVAVAGCHFSLLQSVQPDPGSFMSVHRYSRFNRAAYLLLWGALMFGTNAIAIDDGSVNWGAFLGMTVYPGGIALAALSALRFSLLLFPIWALLGLFPSVATFLHWLGEQLVIHGLGGGGSVSLWSAFLESLKGIVAVVVAWPLVHWGLANAPSGSGVQLGVACAWVYACAVVLSATSDPEYMRAVGRRLCNVVVPSKVATDKLLLAHFRFDLLSAFMAAVAVFILNASTLFLAVPTLQNGFAIGTAIIGILTHYLMHVLRAPTPWKIFGRPFLRPAEFKEYSINGPARVMWFELGTKFLRFIEVNVLAPVVVCGALSGSTSSSMLSSFFLAVCVCKAARMSMVRTEEYWLAVCGALLVPAYDARTYPALGFLPTWFIGSILVSKLLELVTKADFLFVYLPLPYFHLGSMSHVFQEVIFGSQSAWVALVTVLSTVVSSPVYPVAGGALTMPGGARPLRFWERDYNLLQGDELRIADKFAQKTGRSRNSVVYEQLLQPLQLNFASDIQMGRFGRVSSGDVFVLRNESDSVTAFLHVIELGVTGVTFQIRGLEFSGTACHEGELEDINDRAEAVGDAFLGPWQQANARLRSWTLANMNYVMQSYGVSKLAATTAFNLFDNQRTILRYMTRILIKYLLESPHLAVWLRHPGVEAEVARIVPDHVEEAEFFSENLDADYVEMAGRRGVSYDRFFNQHRELIEHCVGARNDLPAPLRQITPDAQVARLCFVLSIVVRRALHSGPPRTEFVARYYRLFQGEVEWPHAWLAGGPQGMVETVILPSVRMTLRFLYDEMGYIAAYDGPAELVAAIDDYAQSLVVVPETHPAWEAAIARGAPSLMSLRCDEGRIFYVVLLSLKYNAYKVVKFNREAVRGLWQAQAQEILFFGNQNSERGSIQQFRIVCRNLINQACDQPIGYAIYVSPLTTSYTRLPEWKGSLGVGMSKLLGSK